MAHCIKLKLYMYRTNGNEAYIFSMHFHLPHPGGLFGSWLLRGTRTSTIEMIMYSCWQGHAILHDVLFGRHYRGGSVHHNSVLFEHIALVVDLNSSVSVVVD